MSLKDLYNSGNQSDTNTNVFCYSINADVIVANENFVADNVTAINTLSGNSLFVADYDVAFQWLTNNTTTVPIPALKGQIDINVANIALVNTNSFSVRLTNSVITNNHQVTITPNLSPSSLTSTEMINFKALINIESICVAGEAIIVLYVLAPISFGVGANIALNFLIC